MIWAKSVFLIPLNTQGVPIIRQTASFENAEKFFVIQIDESKCINCGKCLQVCPLKFNHKNQVLTSYAGYSTDGSILKQSSSGGMFGSFAKYLFNSNTNVKVFAEISLS